MQSSSQCVALNSPHLPQKVVPKILKCRNFRGNESEGVGLACGADPAESTRTPKITELELSLKKIARSKKLQECLGHVSDNFHEQHRAELKEMATRCPIRSWR
jgi:hypothetical protein